MCGAVLYIGYCYNLIESEKVMFNFCVKVGVEAGVMDLQDQVDQEVLMALALRLGALPCNLDQHLHHIRCLGLKQGLDLKVVHHSSEEQAHHMGAQVDLQNAAGLFH